MNNNKSFTVKEIKEKLAKYCAYQDRCHWEVEQKMKEFVLIPEAKDQILLELIQENFLNEERFVKSYVRGKFNQKQWGRIKITQELKKRKINQRLILIGLKEINDSDYFATLKRLIQKKQTVLKESNSYLKKQKIIRYLMQKGYEFELINELLNEHK